jgi:hypothetical protein
VMAGELPRQKEKTNIFLISFTLKL